MPTNTNDPDTIAPPAIPKETAAPLTVPYPEHCYKFSSKVKP